MTTLDDGQVLNPEKSIAASLVGTAVDYLSRFMDGTSGRGRLLRFPCLGLRAMRMEAKALVFWMMSRGYDDVSITEPCRLAGFDSAQFVRGPVLSPSARGYCSRSGYCANIRIMVERSLSFSRSFGPVTADGRTMEGAHAATITIW
ncbi:MAG: hypothetical protein ACLRSA_04465 [Streptococcus salivarius]